MVKELQSCKHTVLVRGNVYSHSLIFQPESSKTLGGVSTRVVAVSFLCTQLKLREDHHWTKKDMSPAGQDLSKVIEQVMRGPGSEVPLTLHFISVRENLRCLKHKLSAPDCVLQLWKSGFLFHKTKQKAWV